MVKISKATIFVEHVNFFSISI